MKSLLIFLLVLLLSTANANFGNEKEAKTEKFGYFSKNLIWSNPVISVCWENPSQQYQHEMRQVQDAVADTWGFYSNLRFVSWNKCKKDEVGVRIKIADEHPHTKGAGKQLSGTIDGMVLNFELTSKDFNWCNIDSTMKELCIKSIAAHEFGHAIGFEHEHLRDDRNANCTDQPPEDIGSPTKLSKYDPHSIMNYCNLVYNNHGRLSYGDVISVREAYGKSGNGI